jgi:flagellar motor switch protein FliN/FliY
MESDMTQTAPAQSAKSLLEEYAAEVGKETPEPGAMGAVLSRKAAGADTSPGGANLDMIMRIPVTVKVVLGSATMPVANLTKLGRGAIIALDRRVGEPVEVVVNGRVIARGEVVVVDEATSRFGISLTEIVGPSGNEKAY